ncbi:MAG TPA: hypothetical protein VFU14_20270 [Acidimicrobiales bacterium]|nr:hypothetical protein [Acidimicrobiales bacterium]
MTPAHAELLAMGHDPATCPEAARALAVLDEIGQRARERHEAAA